MGWVRARFTLRQLENYSKIIKIYPTTFLPKSPHFTVASHKDDILETQQPVCNSQPLIQHFDFQIAEEASLGIANPGTGQT